jgi:hypothetical protein
MNSLYFALDGGYWSVASPSHFTPRERNPSTPWIRHWVGPRVGLDVVVKRKKFFPCPCLELKLGHQAHGLVTILTDLPWLPVIKGHI